MKHTEARSLTLTMLVLACQVSCGRSAHDPESPALLASCDPGLSAAVLDRREASFRLTWTGITGVASYQVRYATVPLSLTNFEDVAVTTNVPYTDAPAAGGVPDGITVRNLLPETSYYFAVAGKDAAGSTISFGTTATAATAKFNVTTLSGSNGATELFGYQLGTEGDVNHDGHSDLLVGSFNGQKAYLYLGVVGPAPTTATVTFSGDATTKSFGRGVAIIGDVDADGIDDLAISDRATTARVFIFRGRTSWPASLTVADASYVITADATYANNALLGASLARLGDFNGDGIDDFAIGAHFYGTGQNGRVIVVLGKSGFGSVQLPDSTNTITIDADPALTTPWFGYRIHGLGHFYNSTGGTTMIVGAPGTSAGTAGSEGRLYAFHGQSGTGGLIPIGAADHVVVGGALKVRLGAVLAGLGPLWSSSPAVASGCPIDRTVPSGSARLFSGSPAAGPFSSQSTLIQTAGAATNNGQVVIGGQLSGIDTVYSLIGDSKPDVIEVPTTATFFYIVDGRALAGPPASPIDAGSVGAVKLALPAGWTTTGEADGKIVPDINGDGYADFAIANATGTTAGKVAIYW
jgi:hypothetical protein